MSFRVIVSIVLLFVVALLALGFMRSELRAAARRRDRRERYRRAGHETGPAPLEMREIPGSISPERARRISSHAEAAASGVATGEQADVANPYAVGSREFVLWQATYLAAMSELAELREARGDGAQQPKP